MPNHAHSSLVIRGDEATLHTIAADLSRDAEDVLSFHNIVPVPAEHRAAYERSRNLLIEGEDGKWVPNPIVDEAEIAAEEAAFASFTPMHEQYRSPLWYEWNCAHWGTKWDAYNICGGDIENGELSYSFTTAWSHVAPVIDALAAKYPTVDISYGCSSWESAFECGIEYVQGVEVDSHYRQLSYEDMFGEEDDSVETEEGQDSQAPF